MSDPIDRETAQAFHDALAPLLVREFREALYAYLQPGCPVPLRDGTYPLLTTLRRGPATATQVAARVGVDRTVVTKQATALEAAGLLQRRPSPHDPRATLLELTPSGLRTARRIETRMLDLISSLSDGGTTGADVTTVAATLTDLRRRLSRTDQPGRAEEGR